AGAGIVETGDDIHFSAAPTKAELPATLGAGKRGDLGLWQIIRLGRPWDERFALFRPREHFRLDALPDRVLILLRVGEALLRLFRSSGPAFAREGGSAYRYRQKTHQEKRRQLPLPGTPGRG